MPVKILRILFILACVTMGIIWANHLTESSEKGAAAPNRAVETAPGQRPDVREIMAEETPSQGRWILLGGGLGLAISFLVIISLHFVTQEVFERIFPAIIAVVLGMGIGYAIAQYILMWYPNSDPNLRVNVVVTLVLVFGFVGISLGLTRASSWESLIHAVSKRPAGFVSPKIIDTSVIIDGRIADICDCGFLEGTLIIPRFVLRELQNIADSSDVLRRAKGRRGLDILKGMQENDGKVHVLVVEDDYDDVSEVDGKLLKLAKQYAAKVVTNDYNLNKVAQIEGVAVLNINDLANALKPAVLPDEPMEVKIVKEGKEPFQGVGYLDDGTMIVVDGGKDYVGKNVAVIVTSVLQTAAGRMIFTKLSHVMP